MSSSSSSGAGRPTRDPVFSRATVAWIIGLLGLIAVIFGPSVNYQFQGYDDLDHVRNNPYLQPLTWSRIWYFWRYPFNNDPVPGVPVSNVGLDAPYHVIYTPLSFTVHALVAVPAANTAKVREATEALAVLDPGWYHGFNVFLHAFNAVALFLLLRRLLRSEIGAGIGALFFAIHPVQVEPICWITGQNNLLSTAFGLLALGAYLGPLRRRASANSNEPGSAAPPWRSRLFYYLSVFLYACAILSKPTTAVLPLVAFILDYAFFERPLLKRVLAVVPWFEISLISALINKSLQTYPMDDIAIPTPNRPFVIGDAFLFYLKQVVWPPYLIPDYGRKPSVVMASPFVYLEWIVPAAIPVLLWYLHGRVKTDAARTSWKAAATGLAGFFLILLPTSGLITYYFHAYSTVADRYLYLPMAGIALALAGAGLWVADSLAQSPSRRPMGISLAVAASVYALLLTVKSAGQAPIWTNDHVLWDHVLTYNDRSWVAWLNRGQSALGQGDNETALADIMRARDMEPENWLIRQSLGNALYTAKRFDEAATEYDYCLKLNPYNSFVDLRMGLIKIQKGKLYEAAIWLNRGLALAPKNPFLLANYGTTLCKLGHLNEGQVALEDAMRHGFDPAVTNLYIGVAQAQQGHLDVAVKYFQRSLELNQNYYESHFNYGLALEKQGKLDAAIQQFQQVMTLEPKYAPAYTGLARIYLAQGHPELAEGPLNDALTLKPGDAETKKLLAKVKAGR